MKILNAFSANMLAGFPNVVWFTEITASEAAMQLVDMESAVGHADTAAVFSSVLGIEIPAQRTTVQLVEGEDAILGQYTGPRLPEGATSLPEGAKITWLWVHVGP